MTNSAIVFMIVVCGIITVATLYCFYRLLTSERQFDSQD